jgi:hypothetical protein
MITGPLPALEPAHELAQRSQDRGGGADTWVPPVMGTEAGEGGRRRISRRR